MLVGLLPESPVGQSFEPFASFRRDYGFVPNLFRAQTLLPRIIEAEARLTSAVLGTEGGLTRTLKECILLAVASVNRSSYCVTTHAQVLRVLGASEELIAGLVQGHRGVTIAAADTALLDFALKLSCHPTLIDQQDTEALRGHGFTDELILEVVLVTALAQFLCILSKGLDVSPDFEPALAPAAHKPPASPPTATAASSPGGYLRTVPLDGATFQPFAFLQEQLGFIPNLYRAQGLRPDLLEAEVVAVGSVLLGDGALSRERKEYILLVVSAANLNTYCVAVHSATLAALGVDPEISDRIVQDPLGAGLPASDVALLGLARRLVNDPSRLDAEDIEGLRRHGLMDEQILEAIVMTALTSFLNTVQMGLGTVPDFPPRRIFPRERVEEVQAAAGAAAVEDPDAALVQRVGSGDLDAFEELVRRHHRRVYRTLLGITGNVQDAEDCAQNAFMKALDHIGEFRAASRFGTWLTRIAINEGLQRVRRHREIVSLDGGADEEAEEFQPRNVLAWGDPEKICSREELRELVGKAVLELPEIYRIVVILRDIEELSTQEAAQVLRLEVGTIKTRLHRGRMMLREALAPHFAVRGREGLGA